MESFFAPLQKYVLDQRRWTTRTELRLAIITWNGPTAAAVGKPAWAD